MDENNKKTPARRRRGGGQRQSGRKNYASEGDVLSEMPVPSGYSGACPPPFPAGFPATPSKSNTGSPAPGSHQANPKSTSKKNGKKGRPDSLSTTPGPLRPGGGTPPQSASAYEAVAFAASRHFYGSPAPSSLPMPKCRLRRSESAGMRPTQEQSPPASDCETPSPSQPAILARPQADENTLNFLFSAHRAEQQRKQQQEKEEQTWKSHSPIPIGRPEQPPFSAPSGLHTSQSLHSFNDQPVPFKLPSRPAQRGVAGNNGHPAAGARPEVFSMPLHERIRAARAAGSHPQHAQQLSPQPRQFDQTQQPQQHLATPPALDKSEQMKRLLGIGGGTPSPKPAPPPTQYHVSPSASLSPSAQPHNGHHNASHHTGHAAPAQSDDLKKRGEDALRQVLGLQLNNFLPISSGFDGNSSPRPQPGPSSRSA